MAATAGYHGYNQSLDTDDTFETIFNSQASPQTKPVWGMEFWCTTDNAQINFNSVNDYGTSGDQIATVVAGEAPVRFYFDQIQKVRAKFATVAGATLSWRTIGG